MSIAVPVILLLLVAGLTFYAFMRASPAAIARSLRLIGPALLGIFGLGMLLLGKAAIGGMLISSAMAWLGANRFSGRTAPTPGQRSRVRSAMLEMELDHDSGQIEGGVLAGQYQNEKLADLSLEKLMILHDECAADEESLRLLETYLDSRFPGWRERFDANDSARHGGPSHTSGMTKEEAYEILGLEAEASAVQIREAHRRLMQRVHPDVGGSSFLAARINEAKDVLLSKHG